MEFKISNIKLSAVDIKRGLRLDGSPNCRLAEFIGILTGDGYANYYPYQTKYILEIAGDSTLDKHYLEIYVSRLIYQLFKIRPSIYKRKDQNSLYLRVISKGLIGYLVNIGFRLGKKNDINIPDWILSKKEYMYSFLKGLADTDCSIHFRGHYPIISFVTMSEPLVSHIFKFLKAEGFILKRYYREVKIDKRGFNNSQVYRIRLNGKFNLQLWLKNVNFRNLRHLRKLAEKMGTREFESRI